jgi:hypothetical protein
MLSENFKSENFKSENFKGNFLIWVTMVCRSF